jgi:hypothetical protein
MAALTPMDGRAAAEFAGIAADVEIVAAAALWGAALGGAAALSWARAPFSASRKSRLASRRA